MAKEIIDIGLAEDDGNGESIRSAFNKANLNFTELYDFDQAAAIAIDANTTHRGQTNNPHGVSATQVGALALDGTLTMTGPVKTSVGTFESSVTMDGTGVGYTLTADNASTSNDKLISLVDGTQERFYMYNKGGTNYHTVIRDNLTVGDANPNNKRGVSIEKTYTTTANTQTGTGVDIYSKVDNVHNLINAIGVTIKAETIGSGSSARSTGLNFAAVSGGSTDITSLIGIAASVGTANGALGGASGNIPIVDINTAMNGLGTFGAVQGLRVNNLGDSNINSVTGLFIANQSGSGTNVGIRLSGNGVGSDIIFGSSGSSKIQEQGGYLELIADVQAAGGRWVQTTGDHKVTGGIGLNGTAVTGQATAMTAADASAPAGTDATIIANLQTRVNELEAMLDATTGIGVVA